MHGEELMARITHAAQIDLRFGDRRASSCSVWRLSRQFRARAFPPLRTRLDRSKLAGSTRGGVRFAPCEHGPRGSRAVLARAFLRSALILRSLVKPHFSLVGVVSITLNSASSSSCTLCRSVSPRTARRRSIFVQAGVRAFGDGD